MLIVCYSHTWHSSFNTFLWKLRMQSCSVSWHPVHVYCTQHAFLAIDNSFFVPPFSLKSINCVMSVLISSCSDLGCDVILTRLRAITARQLESSFLQALPFNDFQSAHYVSLLVAFPSSYWRDSDRQRFYD